MSCTLLDEELEALDPAERKWREDLGIKSKVDVLDSYDHWCEATVEKASPSHVFVHYDYWSSRWDEWISRASPRLARSRTRICEYYYMLPLRPEVLSLPDIAADVDGGTLRKNQQLEVYDNHPAMKRYLPAFIIDENEKEVLVHFKV